MCLSMIINLKIVQVNHPVTLTAVGGGGKTKINTRIEHVCLAVKLIVLTPNNR